MLPSNHFTVGEPKARNGSDISDVHSKGQVCLPNQSSAFHSPLYWPIGRVASAGREWLCQGHEVGLEAKFKSSILLSTCNWYLLPFAYNEKH